MCIHLYTSFHMTKRRPTDGIGRLFFLSELSDAVYSLGQTGNLAGSGILVIHSLGSRLAHDRNRSLQAGLCGLSVLCSNCSIHFLNRSLNLRFDCLISCCSGLGNQNSLLCRLMLANPYTSKIIIHTDFICTCSVKAGHGRLYKTYSFIVGHESFSVNT